MKFLKAFPFLFVAILSQTLAAESEQSGPLFKQWEQDQFHQKYIVQNQHLELFGLMQIYTAAGQEEGSVPTVRSIKAYGVQKGWKDFMIEDSSVEGKDVSDNILAIGFLVKALFSFPKEQNEQLYGQIVGAIQTLYGDSESHVGAYVSKLGSLNSGGGGGVRLTVRTGGTYGSVDPSPLSPRPQSCCKKYGGYILCSTLGLLIGGAGGFLITYYGFHG